MPSGELTSAVSDAASRLPQAPASAQRSMMALAILSLSAEWKLQLPAALRDELGRLSYGDPAPRADTGLQQRINWVNGIIATGDREQLKAHLPAFLSITRQAHRAGADIESLWDHVPVACSIILEDEAMTQRSTVAKSLLQTVAIRPECLSTESRRRIELIASGAASVGSAPGSSNSPPEDERVKFTLELCRKETNVGVLIENIGLILAIILESDHKGVMHPELWISLDRIAREVISNKALPDRARKARFVLSVIGRKSPPELGIQNLRERLELIGHR